MHEIYMRYGWLTDEIRMTCRWDTDDLQMRYGWLTDEIWITYRCDMDDLLNDEVQVNNYGLRRYAWDIHEIRMTYRWDTDDLQMRCGWLTDEIRMTYRWDIGTYRCDMDDLLNDEVQMNYGLDKDDLLMIFVDDIQMWQEWHTHTRTRRFQLQLLHEKTAAPGCRH